MLLYFDFFLCSICPDSSSSFYWINKIIPYHSMSKEFEFLTLFPMLFSICFYFLLFVFFIISKSKKDLFSNILFIFLYLFFFLFFVFWIKMFFVYYVFFPSFYESNFLWFLFLTVIFCDYRKYILYILLFCLCF